MVGQRPRALGSYGPGLPEPVHYAQDESDLEAGKNTLDTISPSRILQRLQGRGVLPFESTVAGTPSLRVRETESRELLDPVDLISLVSLAVFLWHFRTVSLGKPSPHLPSTSNGPTTSVKGTLPYKFPDLPLYEPDPT